MQLSDYLSNKDVIQQFVNQLQLSRVVGRIVKDLEQNIIFRRRNYMGEYDESYEILNHSLHVVVDFRERTLTMEYKDDSISTQYDNYNNIGYHIGYWIHEMIRNTCIPFKKLVK